MTFPDEIVLNRPGPLAERCSVVNLVSLWRHPGFRKLSDAERQVTWYCLSGPQTNAIGLFVLSVPTMADDLDRQPGDVLTAFARTCKSAGWPYDDTARVLFIPSWWRYSLPTSLKAFRAALQDLTAVPTASPLVERFLKHRAHVPVEWHPVLEAVLSGVPLRIGKTALSGPDAPADGPTDLLGAVAGPQLVVSNTLSDLVVGVWNELAQPPIPRVSRLTRQLRQKIADRWKTYGKIEYFRLAFQDAMAQPWFCGTSDDPKFAGWVGDIDVVLKSDESFRKFLDRGVARNRTVSASSRPRGCHHTPACTSATACTEKFLVAHG